MLSFVVIGGVGLIGFMWLSRGFFSALLNLACVLTAGAIAFGFWEPLAYLLLEKAPDRGIGSFLIHNAWGLSLGLAFAASLALLRLAVDSFVRSNVIVDSIADYIGGAVCGLMAGTISVGIIVIAVGFLRLGSSFMGYMPVDFNANGAVQRKSKLILPADTIVAKLYGSLSRTTLSTDQPLATWYPELASSGPAMRLNFGDGKARNTVKPRDVQVTGHYAVANERKSLGELTSDIWNPQEQNLTDLDGKPMTGAARLEGFVVKFGSGAKEKTGQVVVGNAQLRLLVEDAEGNTSVVHPIAVISQASSERVAYGRFRYDSGGSGVHIASVGGASEVTMGFEFPIPEGSTAKALYIKNVRFEVGKPTQTFADTAQRDSGIRDGTLLSVDVDLRGPDRPQQGTEAEQEDPTQGTRVNNQLQFVIQSGNQGSLEVNDDRRILDGEQNFDPRDINNWKLIDQQLRIQRLAVTPDVVIVQVDVSINRPGSWLGRVADAAQLVTPPLLIDRDGVAYDPVGFVYEDQTEVRLRYTPGKPLRGLTEVPSLSSSRTDQKLTLIFRVSRGVELASFRIGNETLITYKPPIRLNDPQR